MFEKKLDPSQNWLTILPIMIILGVIAFTLTGALAPGKQPRELVFDTFMRISARDAGTALQENYAILDINQESLERIGPWPWPRTTLAELVNAAQSAGAKNVILTIPVEGSDPLSPEVQGQYWFKRTTPETQAIAEAVAALPSHDVALAQSFSEIPSAFAVGEKPLERLGTARGWARTSVENIDWLALVGGAQARFVSLPLAYTRGQVSNSILATATASVSALPTDTDGKVRRVKLLWNAYETALPSTSLAASKLEGQAITAKLHEHIVQSVGKPIQELQVGQTTFNLDRDSNAILYFPQNTSVQTIPAWRVLSDNPGWRQILQDKTILIGETATSGALLNTPRGRMSRAQLHTLMTDQIAQGETVHRPEWSGLGEAGIALLLGVGAILAALLLSGTKAATYTISLSILLVVLTWIIFVNSGMLIDPLPGIFAMVGSQLGFVASSMAGSVWRDDAVRGAFHGALPPSAMNALQKDRRSTLLDGVRRQVTVLSCTVRLPEHMEADFINAPDAYIKFRAQTNDKLRQSILSLGGTVDYGEDGRLLGYWNVPEENKAHIERACSCALQMIEDMNTLAQDLQTAQSVRSTRFLEEEKASAFEQGHLEIGISSDVCFSGPVGRAPRNRYAVVGQAVAMASALRNRSRIYGPAIICDETVYTALRHHFAFLDLDTLQVNDEPQPRPIYGLVGNPFLKASKAFRTMADTQRALVNAWREGNFKEAEAYRQQLEKLPGTHDAYLSLYKERINVAMLEQSAANGDKKAGWDGTQKIIL